VATFTDGAGEPAVGYVQFIPRNLRATVAGGGLLAPVRVRAVLDSMGGIEQDLEPGAYNAAIVLQYARTVYVTIEVPAGAATVDLFTLLAEYTPGAAAAADGVWGLPGTYEWAIPFSATTIDYVLLGGGGGGNGSGAIAGRGGGAGVWLHGTLVRGGNIPSDTQVITVTVGAGGSAGPGAPANGPGGNGSASSITFVGIGAPLSAAGGAGGANTVSSGWGVPSLLNFNGRDYPGGAQQIRIGGGGFWPGGGGAGGVLLLAGGPGAHGAVWLRAYTEGT
jgi:hypothetical protein